MIIPYIIRGICFTFLQQINLLSNISQILYERLLSAKQNSASSELKWRNSKDTDSDPYARWVNTRLSL